MDKDQATDFIIRQYSMGYAREDIATQLSQQLGAPLEIVARFVGQTIDQHFPNLPAAAHAASAAHAAHVQTPASAPPPKLDYSPADFYTEPSTDLDRYSQTLEEEDGFIDLDALDRSAPTPAGQDFYRASANPWDQSEDPYQLSAQGFAAQNFAPERATGQDFEPEVPEYTGQPYQAAGTSFEASAGLSEASLYDPAYNLPSPSPSQNQAQQRSNSEVLEDDPDVQSLVVKALGKNTKQSDVVMMVCEHYGLDWKEAQRLVARIHSKNRKVVASHQNRLLIPMSALAVIGGVALVIAGIMELISLRAVYASAASTTDYQVIDSSYYYIRRILPMTLLGIGLFVGGLFGLIKSIRAQVE